MYVNGKNRNEAKLFFSGLELEERRILVRIPEVSGACQRGG
jgi:hypothetical protein